MPSAGTGVPCQGPEPGDRLVEIGASHLYPGARGTVSPPLGPEAAGAGTACLVLFADGGRAAARLGPMRAGRAALAVAAHVTARGRAIPAKSWTVTLAADGAALRVAARGAPE
jgi:hypothetical protein